MLVNISYLFSRRSGRTMAFALPLIPIALWLTPGAVWSRLEMGWGQGANEVSAGRVTDIWLPLVQELPKHPIFGNGLDAVMWSAPMIREEMFQVGHPHNAYLQAYLDMGAVGLVLLLAFWIVMWRRFRALSRDQRIAPELQGFFEGAAAGLVAFLVAGVAGSSLEPVPEQAFLWLAVGLMFGIQAKLAAASTALVKRGKG